MTKIYDNNATLRDQRGNKSSKRVWANRFGWMTLIQVILQLGIVCTFLLLGKPIQGDAAEVLKYCMVSTLSGCLLCLGLTIPEWFAKTPGNSIPNLPRPIQQSFETQKSQTVTSIEKAVM